MTREEHYKIVDAVINASKDNEMGGKYSKAFNHGVNSAFNRVCIALHEIEEQQQPSEDCISREAVKNGMIKYGFHAPDMTVTEFVEDCLPPVILQRKMGRWIFNEKLGHQYCCSECGNPMPTVNDYYRAKLIGCPYCLADMREGNK